MPALTQRSQKFSGHLFCWACLHQWLNATTAGEEANNLMTCHHLSSPWAVVSFFFFPRLIVPPKCRPAARSPDLLINSWTVSFAETLIEKFAMLPGAGGKPPRHVPFVRQWCCNAWDFNLQRQRPPCSALDFSRHRWQFRMWSLSTPEATRVIRGIRAQRTLVGGCQCMEHIQ